MRIRLDIPLECTEISQFAKEGLIEYISTDTRNISPGDLFIPIIGKNFDGRIYAPRAREIGATVLDTDDGALSLLRLAALYKSKLKGLKYTVGITGSVGKTTAKEFVYKIASEKYKSHKTSANENNIIGVAKSILTAPANTEVLILEIGTNHNGEIKKIVDLIPPDIALITNIGTAHIGNFGSRDAIKREKLSVSAGGKARLISRHEDDLGGHTFSAKSRDADLFIERTPGGILIYKSGETPLYSECIFYEKHLLEELAAAASVCIGIGLDKEELKRGISSLSYENTRQNIFAVGDLSIYSDCYNASIESFASSFESLSSMNGYSAFSAVVGDIDELSEMSEAIHYELGRMLQQYNFRKIYLTGDMQYTVKCGFSDAGGEREKIHFIDKSKMPSDIAEEIIEGSLKNEIILFKASRKMRLEVIIDEIKRRCKN